MGRPNSQKPSIARLVGFFAAGIASAWDYYAKPGGWIDFAITTYVITFLFTSTIWGLVSMFKADRAEHLAERARLKAFNDDNERRRSIEDPNDTSAQ